MVAVTASASCSPRAPRSFTPAAPASRNSSSNRPRSQRRVLLNRGAAPTFRGGGAATLPAEWQTLRSGHESQSGVLARQCAFARSIAACAHAPASFAFSSAPKAFAAAWSGFGVSFAWPVTRWTTRAMFTSTGISLPPNAIAATARAVYGPMPGRSCNSSCVAGRPPAACAACAARCSERARRL